jgi:hypothetical protein
MSESSSRKFRLKHNFGGDENRWREAAQEISAYETYLRAVPQHQLRSLVNEDVTYLDKGVTPDYDSWGSERFWTLDEAISLSLETAP